MKKLKKLEKLNSFKFDLFDNNNSALKIIGGQCYWTKKKDGCGDCWNSDTSKDVKTRDSQGSDAYDNCMVNPGFDDGFDFNASMKFQAQSFDGTENLLATQIDNGFDFNGQVSF